MKRFIHKIQYLIATIFVSVRMGIPLREAWQSMIEAEQITWENDL